MAVLASQTRTGLDITDEAEVLSYRYDGVDPREVIIRVNLGDDAGPVVGGDNYRLRVYLGGVLVAPDTDVKVPDDKASAIMISRPIPIESGDELSVRVIGLAGDTSVNTVTSVRDATPAKVSDLTGSGPTLVDHNYGGTDNLAVMTADGVRIEAATLAAYRESDYLAGRRTQEFAVANSRTNVDGRWTEPMALSSGSYLILVYKQGVIRPRTVAVEVA